MDLAAKLHRVAMRMLRDDAEADDAMQESFMKLWRTTPPASEGEARNRLVAVLRNECVDRLRRRRTFVGTDTLADIPDDAPPMSPSEFEAVKRGLYGALSDVQREVFELATFNDMEYAEIASRMGLSVEAVRVNMCRARKKLRESLNNL